MWVGFFAAALSLLHIWINLFGSLSTLVQNGVHFAGFILLCAFTRPLIAADPTKTLTFFTWRKIGRGLDLGFSVLVAACVLYLVLAEDAIYDRGVRLVLLDWIAGSIVLLGAIEFTRRTTGWIIPILIVFALTYAGLWGGLVPGVFKFPGLSLETLLFRSIYGDDALFGNIALISSSFVFMFILFGAFLLKSGAGDFIIDISRLIAGRFVGGPGLVAVFASGLTGTISGSAVANTASTGVITIPMMKRAGFAPHHAGAIESAASTGGQLMPPIMGAGAFVMAATTQIPYTTIIAVSALPAILYFASITFFVRNAARAQGQLPLTTDANTAESTQPGFIQLLQEGGISFLFSITVLMGLLINGFSPTYAALWAIISCVVASLFTKKRMGPRAIFEALALGAQNMVMTAILLCAVGLIVNIIATAGIGNIFSLMISEWAGGSLFVAIVLVGLASLVLGMGLPVTAAYIVLGTLSAPALYLLIAQDQLAAQLISGTLPEAAHSLFMLSLPADQLASLTAPMDAPKAYEILAQLPQENIMLVIDYALSPAILTTCLLSAHMIVFWLSQDSNVTPPVCLAAFTAAAIAKAPAMKTGFAAWRVAKGLYIIPFLFAYTPFLSGDWQEMILIFLFALPGLWALVGMLEKMSPQPADYLYRLLLLGLGIALLWPIAVSWKCACLAGLLLVAWSRHRLRTPVIFHEGDVKT